jgi:SAM-dependent methyltransferase
MLLRRPEREPVRTEDQITNRGVRRFFDRSAEAYTARSAGTRLEFSSFVFQRRQDIVKAMLPRLDSGRVLDFGMGPGVYAAHCVALGFEYLGIDTSPEMVARARALDVPDAEFAVGGVDMLWRLEEQFDVVMAIGVLDYVEPPEEGLRALCARVKEGGYLVLSYRNRYALPSLLRDGLRHGWQALRLPQRREAKRLFFAPIPERPFDLERELRPVLTEEGFADVEVRFLACSPLFFNVPLPAAAWRRWNELDARIARPSMRWLCLHAVLRARKRPGVTGHRG